MSYRLIYERRFLNDLVEIPASEKPTIKHRLEWLSENVLVIGHFPLKERRYRGVFRLRIGRWRIFYRLDHKKKTIFILSIKDRKEAYR